MSLMATAVVCAQDLEPAEPIRPDFLAFLQYQFEQVPAASVVMRLPQSTCSKIIIPASVDNPPGVEMYLCDVDLGCGSAVQVPVAEFPDGKLAFFPDTPEEVVYYACPESISDPIRRAEIERELALPPLTITRIE